MLESLVLPVAQATTSELPAETVATSNHTAEQIVDKIVSLGTVYGLNVIGAIIILVVGSMVAKVVSKKVEKLVLHKENTDPSLGAIARKLVYAALMLVVLIIVLGKFGVETASLIALLGTAGLAIGLALQGTLSNIASGVMILVLRPFRAGNAVKIGGGEVYLIDEIGLFVTKAHQPDCPRVMIPNSQIWGSIIVNFSDTVNEQRRFDIMFGISYGDDINTALRILEELAASDSRILKDPAPFIKVDSLGDSSVNILFRVYAPASEWWPARLDLTKAGKEALEAGGCSIPFPQRDVHIFRDSEKAAG